MDFMVLPQRNCLLIITVSPDRFFLWPQIVIDKIFPPDSFLRSILWCFIFCKWDLPGSTHLSLWLFTFHHTSTSCYRTTLPWLRVRSMNFDLASHCLFPESVFPFVGIRTS